MRFGAVGRNVVLQGDDVFSGYVRGRAIPTHRPCSGEGHNRRQEDGELLERHHFRDFEKGGLGAKECIIDVIFTVLRGDEPASL